MTVKLPNFEPRPYQIPFMKAMDEGCQRAVLVWHRRAGKEIVCWNWLVKMAFWHRVGTYVYFFPTSRLGRRILWDGADKDGRKFRDMVPKEIIASRPNMVDMKVTLKNGSVIQIVGTDSIVNVGINPVGCVFSEFSLQNPQAWNLIRPILRENGGWSVFNFTPRGKNHAFDLFQMAKNNPEWYCQKLSIDDTNVLSEDDMQKERDEGMSEQLIQQEYYCSFDQGVEGAYYAKLLYKAELEGRITSVPHDPMAPVDTYWDIGVGDYTCIIWAQNVGQEIHIIDCYSHNGEGLGHYIGVLRHKSEKFGWVYRDHYAPHDIEVREWGSGAVTRRDTARNMGIDFQIVPKLSISEGIEMCRNIFNRLWIDQYNCKFFLKCAENYHKSYNEKLNVFSDQPVHDFSSHMMDAFRMLAVTQCKLRQSSRMSEDDAQDMERRFFKSY